MPRTNDAAEYARLAHASRWNAETQTQEPEPGTLAEERALAAIDLRRENEQRARQDTPQIRRARSRRYWRPRAHWDILGRGF